MTRRTIRAILATAAATALGLGLMVVPADAATTTSCPTSAETMSVGSFLPPYAAGDAITDLVGCGAPFDGNDPASLGNVDLQFGDLGITDEACATLEAIEVSVTGSPGAAGYGLITYVPSTDAFIPLAGGQTAFYQQYDAAEGDEVSDGGLSFFSPSAQPASGSYTVTAGLDPTAVSLAQLAAGDLAVAVLVIGAGDPPDVVESVTVTVTTDDSGCEPTTTTTVAPTTSTTAAVAAVEVTPAFTG
jgi:hypothetical protein